MKPTRSILSSVAPTTIVILLACLPLLELAQVLANSQGPRPSEIQPMQVPIVSQSIQPPPIATMPAPAPVANAPAPQPIPIPIPPVAATPNAPSVANAELPELAPAVTLPMASPLELVAMTLVGLLAMLWARLHRAPSPCSLRGECA